MEDKNQTSQNNEQTPNNVSPSDPTEPDVSAGPVSQPGPSLNTSVEQPPELHLSQPTEKIVSQPVVTDSPHTDKSKKAILLLIIALIIILVGGLYLFARHTPNKSASIANTSSQSSGVTISNVTIPAGVNKSQVNASCDGEGGCQNPEYTCLYSSGCAATSNRDYIYIDTISNPYKAIYDSRTILESDNIIAGSEAISQNGLHYAFLYKDGMNSTIYIDGKPSAYVFGNGNVPKVDAVSNDGKSVVYGDNQGYYKNGVALETNEQTTQAISQASFSSNLDQSIFITNGDENSSSNPQVILNGKIVSTSDVFSQAAISGNGLHSAYLVDNPTNTNLYVDGQNLGSIDDCYDLGVTDEGDYYYIDQQANLLYINKKAINLASVGIHVKDSGSADLFNENNQAVTLNIYLNAYASHYLMAYTNSNSNTNYYLDGKHINLNGYIDKVALENNTMYVYKFSD